MVVYARMRFSVILLTAGLIGCSTPVTTQAWGENTMRLASALELSGATLQVQARAHFTPDSPEFLSVSLTGRNIENEFARQVIAWKALDAYASDVQRVLDGHEMESERVKQMALAFHDLHRHLLQSGIAGKLGLTVERHRTTVQEILATKSMVSALEVAQPAVSILCTHLAAACKQLELELDDWLDTCLRQIDSKWHTSLNGYAVLLARKRDLETIIAAQAAGAAMREGDPSGELLKVETLVRNSEGWRSLYAEEQTSVALAFRDARSHVRKTAHAVLEWGIAHREITKAMRSDSGFVNIRLLEASANELAPASVK
ncbi:MAG: hypothetical protein COA70_01805 [Planctomycetota bacterium]|nr:MAG: hypothetical protein COA70_01805 [Planctomycetota bacterium]